MLENTTTFQLSEWAQDFRAIERAMERGETNAALIIPPGFERQFNALRGEPSLMVLLNGSESVAATAALRAVEGVGRTFSERMVVQRLNFGE